MQLRQQQKLRHNAQFLVRGADGSWTAPRLQLRPNHPRDWAVAVAAGFIGVAWFEVYKTVTVRHRAQTPTRAGAASANRPGTR